MKSAYDFNDYKDYLAWALGPGPKGGRGSARKLAQAMGCNSTYLSHVLHGKAHLSPDQAHAAARFFELTDDETSFFLLSLQWTRAGDPKLREHTAREMERRLEARSRLKNRLEYGRALTPEDQLTYFGSWIYPVTHLLLTTPDCDTAQKIADRTGQGTKRIDAVLEFLALRGMAEMIEGSKPPRYRTGKVSIHLGDDQAMVAKHHINWRMQAIQHLDRLPPKSDEFLHYSSVVSLSREDIPKVRAIQIDAIERIREIVRNSAEETVACYAMDLFSPLNEN